LTQNPVNRSDEWDLLAPEDEETLKKWLKQQGSWYL